MLSKGAYVELLAATVNAPGAEPSRCESTQLLCPNWYEESTPRPAEQGTLSPGTH